MSQSLRKQLTFNVLNRHSQPQQSLKKYSQIVQLKNELVKMKEFLNKQLPSLKQLIPCRKNQQQQVESPIHNYRNRKVEQVFKVNRKLKQVNKKLSFELFKEKNQKRQLSQSLKKQQRMLYSIYTSRSKQQSFNKQNKKINANNSKSENKNLFLSPANINNHYHTPKILKPQRNRQQREIYCIYNRTPVSSNQSQNPMTQPSIQKNICQTSKDSFQDSRLQIYQPSSRYQQTETDIMTVELAKQIQCLENKMKNLMRESQRTENRAKKLQIRTQLQKVANKLHYLKQYLGKSTDF